MTTISVPLTPKLEEFIKKSVAEWKILRGDLDEL